MTDSDGASNRLEQLADVRELEGLESLERRVAQLESTNAVDGETETVDDDVVTWDDVTFEALDRRVKSLERKVDRRHSDRSLEARVGRLEWTVNRLASRVGRLES